MAYKKLIKVSNVCQLLDKSKFPVTQTINGVTFTNNEDGTITVNGTATKAIYYGINRFIGSLYLSHKYLVTGESSGLMFFVENRDENDNILLQLNPDTIKTLPSNTKISAFECYIKQGTVCDNLVLKPQFFDLTEMYGAGNEPTTVEEFRENFPNELYDYKPYCFVKSYKKLIKVSNVCQLLDNSKYPATKTINGVTFTNNGDGTFTVNGTAESGSGFRLDTFYIEGNRTYLMTGCPKGGGAGKYFMFDGYSKLGSDLGSGVIKTVSGSDKTLCSPILYVVTGQTVSNLVFKPQIFDLTEMYGAGHEPTTVQQFRQDFPEELYDYKPYTIIPSYKRNLTCKTKNLFDINSAVKVSGGSSFSKNGNQITVSGNSGYRYISANVLLDTSLVGKTVTFSAYAKTSDKNTACLRIQWLAPTGLASSAYVQSASVGGQAYQRVRLTGVIPTQPDDTYNMLCLSFYSNGYNDISPLPS